MNLEQLKAEAKQAKQEATIAKQLVKRKKLEVKLAKKQADLFILPLYRTTDGRLGVRVS